MTWRDALDYLEAVARIDREHTIRIAIAARAAQADEKGWKKWLEHINR